MSAIQSTDATKPVSTITAPNDGTALRVGRRRHHQRNGLRCRRRHRRGRGLDRWRHDVAPGGGRRNLELQLGRSNSGHVYDQVPGGGRQRQPGDCRCRPDRDSHRQQLFFRFGHTAHRAGCRCQLNRSRDEVPIFNGRHRNGRAVLQERLEHRPAYGLALVEHGDPTGDSHLHQRIRSRLADGELFHPGRDHRRHDLCGLVSHQLRALCGNGTLFRVSRNKWSPYRTDECRCLHLQFSQRLPDQHLQRRELLGRCLIQPGGSQHRADGCRRHGQCHREGRHCQRLGRLARHRQRADQRHRSRRRRHQDRHRGQLRRDGTARSARRSPERMAASCSMPQGPSPTPSTRRMPPCRPCGNRPIR